jgi:hypothetical protein
MSLKLFTYADPENGRLSDPHETDIENPPDTDRPLLELLGEFCPVERVKAIWLQVCNQNLWLGIGKRPSEVVSCWHRRSEEGKQHPWLPEILTTPGPNKINLVAEEAAPITQDTLYDEVRKMPELYKLSWEKPIKSITVKPAWRRPNEIKKEFVVEVSLDGNIEYQLNNVAGGKWLKLFDVMLAQFLRILPVLKKMQGSLQLVDVSRDDCILDPNTDYRGLCGAWYIVTIQGIPQAGSKSQKTLEVRIPVGLLEEKVLRAGGVPFPERVSFDLGNKSNVYTYGLDFRFLCEKEEKLFFERSYDLQLDSNWNFLKGILIGKNVLNSASFNFKAPLEKFKVHENRNQWRMEQDPDKKAILAGIIVPDVIGEEPLAIFTETGIHILQSKNQIGAVCARNNLLEKLFYVPPWSSNTIWLNEPLGKVWEGDSWTIPLNDKSDVEKVWPGGKQALEDELLVFQGEPPILSASCVTKQLASVLGSSDKGTWDLNKDDWERNLKYWSIKGFRQLNVTTQLTQIDAFWDILTTPFDFNKLPKDMYEPTQIEPFPDDISSDIRIEFRPLPTSWRPEGFILENYETIYHTRLLELGKWQELGVGFRLEGEWADLSSTLDRYQLQGMTQWRENQELMAKMSGFYIKGTKLETELDKARFWNGNHDILNQTAVCVSRNFFGALKFPDPHSQGEYCLFAVDCSDLQGLDTEWEQLNIFRNFKTKVSDWGKIARWYRPGEKAFQKIPWENVISWVCVKRLGIGNKGGWAFIIDPNEKWEKNTNPAWLEKCKKTPSDNFWEQKKLQYIKEELNAWKATRIDVPIEFDFVMY